MNYRFPVCLFLYLELGSISQAGPDGKAASPMQTPAADDPFANTLTGDWGGTRRSLMDNGVAVDLSTTGYYAGLLEGTLDDDFEWGGRADAFLKFDTGRPGLRENGGLHVPMSDSWPKGREDEAALAARIHEEQESAHRRPPANLSKLRNLP